MPRTSLLILLALAASAARAAGAPALREPDERYKADLLVVVAHPDDESGDIAGYLARAIYDQHRRVAVVFINRGQDGGNEAGPEEGNVLGAEREIEGRRALASLGVENVWFLDAPNVSTQNVINSLERWGHGAVLEQVVRLVRLTRPEVIVTWLPAYVAGENHADHQAASVIANEAFDLAGDPAIFGEQLVAERGGQSGEGLIPWQPQKIYYFSDNFDYPIYGEKPQLASPYRKPIAEGRGPVYSNTEISPTQHTPYSRLAARETSFYLTQDGQVAVDAIAKRDFTEFERPARLILGKSLVGGSATGDVFEGVVATPVPFRRVMPHEGRKQPGLSLELGGPWSFYREFWEAHNLEHLAELLPVAEAAIRVDHGYQQFPLLIRNNTQTPQEVTITSVLPEGWSDKSRQNVFVLSPGRVQPLRAVLAPVGADKQVWQEITWRALVNNREAGQVTLHVLVGASGVMHQ